MAISKIRNGVVDIIGLGDETAVVRETVSGGIATITIDGIFDGAEVDFGYYTKDGNFSRWVSDLQPVLDTKQLTIRTGSIHPLVVRVVSSGAATDIRVTAGDFE